MKTVMKITGSEESHQVIMGCIDWVQGCDKKNVQKNMI